MTRQSGAEQGSVGRIENNNPPVPEAAGASQSDMIPLSVPQLQGKEWEYVKDCLDTNWISSAGGYVTRFERMVADQVGAEYGVATSSGTAALHVALLVSGVEPDDEVLVSTLTFIAPANAIRYAGAWPVFIDADPDYWQMDPQRATEFLENNCHWRDGALLNKGTGRRVKAVLPVHILGHPCDMEPLLALASKYDLAVIEDATESLGARYQDRPVGCLGDIACLSFNGNKLVTTGGGGMIVTDNRDWADRATYLTTLAKDDPVEYIHNEIGFNYRLTNLQAALGCAQMEHIDDHIARKRSIAAAYSERLEEVPGLTSMQQAPWAESVFWMFTALVDEVAYGMNSRELMQHLAEGKIQSRPLWQPMHLSRAHSGNQVYHNGAAEEIFRDALSLPCSVGLSDRDLERVLELLVSLAR